MMTSQFFFEERESFNLRHLHCTLPSLSNPVKILCWSLWNSTMAQGTLLDLHGPPMDPKMDPVRKISGDPWWKKALHGLKLNFFI